jgi:hypothetical protein
MDNKLQSKIIILGIDGLDYYLVKKWKLQNLMQKTYCKLDLSDYRVKVTPPIWGSMITGKIDEEVMDVWIRAAQFVNLKSDVKQKWWAEIVTRFLPHIPAAVKNKVLFRLLERMGENPFEVTSNYVNEKKLTNIFQFFKNPWTNGIPSYGRLDNTPERRNLFERATSGEKTNLRDYEIKNYKKDKIQLFSILEKDGYDLIFWYTALIDSLGHLYIGKKLTLMKYYLEINKLVGEVREKYNDCQIYIVSDHGMEEVERGWGMHSDYAFFSSNTGERINKPTELFDLILQYKNI